MHAALAIQELLSQMMLPRPAIMGEQMATAVGIVNAATPDEVDEALPAAVDMAVMHDFYLPEPDPEKGRIVEQYRGITVPYFVHQMRERFDRAVENASAIYGSVSEGVLREEIALPLLPDVVRAGLVTFESADALLAGLERELAEGMEVVPPALASENPYFGIPSVIGRVVFDLVVLGGGVLLFENDWNALWVVLGAAPATEAISYLKGRGVKSERDAANRERAAALAGYRGSLESLEQLRSELGYAGEEAPAAARPPEPVTLELRRTLLRNKQGKRRGWIDIVTGLPTLEERANTIVKYYAVEMPDGRGREIRIMSPNLIHPLAYVDGDMLVGAGYLVYRTGGQKRPSIAIDGRSRTHPTDRDSVGDTVPSMLSARRGLEAVSELIREALGDDAGIEVEIKRDVHRS